MNEHPLDPGLFAEMVDSIQESYERHKEHYGESVKDFSSQVEKAYKIELDHVLSILSAGLRSDAEGTPTPVYHVLRDYLHRMQWVGWGDCEFGPALGTCCPEDEYALSILVYLSARLLDDGIDGHMDYKGSVRNLYGFLAERMHEREAAVLNCSMGNLILNGSLRRLIRKGYTRSADKLMQLYSRVFPGAMVEAFCSGRAVPYEVYRSVVERKSVAYDMMLHWVFFSRTEPVLRARILEFLAGYSEVAQWLNDLCDEEDDRARGQLNILNIPGMTRENVFNRIVHSFHRLWEENRVLPRNLRDVIAVRLRDSIRRLPEVECGGVYKALAGPQTEFPGFRATPGLMK